MDNQDSDDRLPDPQKTKTPLAKAARSVKKKITKIVTKPKSGKYDTEDPATSAETEESEIEHSSQQEDNLEREEENGLQERTKLIQQVGTLQEQIGQLSDENKGLKGQMGQLSDENKGLKGQMGQLSDENKRLKGQIGQLSDENKDLNRQMSKLSTVVEKLEGRMSDLVQVIELQKENGTQYAKKMADERAKSMAKEKHQEKEISELTRKLKDTEKQSCRETTALRKELATKEEMDDEKNERIRELERKNWDLRMQNKHLKENTCPKCPCCKAVCGVKRCILAIQRDRLVVPEQATG